MDLYPTESRVYDMLCCAGKCGKRTGSECSSSESSSPEVHQPYLTFGEDFFSPVAEMKRAYAEEAPTAAPASKIAHKNSDKKLSLPTASELKSNCHSSDCEVFLGGSCNPTTWRQDIAIPTLKNLGITFFNPQVPDWFQELIEIEHNAKTKADVLFYVVDSQTRAVVVMIEVAYLVAKQRNVILVITGFKGPGQRISDEPLSQAEYEDLTWGQLILQDIVERHGIPVFNDIPAALQCTAKVIRERVRPQDLKLSDLPSCQSGKCIQNSNKKDWVCSNLKMTFDGLDSRRTGQISLTDLRLAYKMLMSKELNREQILNVLKGLEKAEDENDLISTPMSGTIPTSTTTTNNAVTKNCSSQTNGCNGTTMLNYEEFRFVMSELLNDSPQRNSSHAWSNQLATKASQIVDQVKVALTRLLDYVPSSKPGWNPLVETPTLCAATHDVYLGGSCSSEDNWREDVAIPLLGKHGCSYLSPDSSRSFTPMVDLGIEKCRVLLFHMPRSCRGVDSMPMAAYHFGLGYEVVVCVESLEDECHIDGEQLSQVAIKDYNRGRSYLRDMAEREGVPVFKDLDAALHCVLEKVKGNASSASSSPSS